MSNTAAQLYIRTAPDTFRPHGKPSSYHAAVRLGQDRAGYGQFYVERTDGKAPSREEQLLLSSESDREAKLALL